MIGFKISYKEEITKIGLSKGVTSINLTRVLIDDRDKLDLYAGGLDTEINRHIRWLRTDLNIGDKITIEVQDLDVPSNPIEIVEEEPDEIVLEAKLRSYKSLKKELEEKGLI